MSRTKEDTKSESECMDAKNRSNRVIHICSHKYFLPLPLCFYLVFWLIALIVNSVQVFVYGTVENTVQILVFHVWICVVNAFDISVIIERYYFSTVVSIQYHRTHIHMECMHVQMDIVPYTSPVHIHTHIRRYWYFLSRSTSLSLASLIRVHEHVCVHNVLEYATMCLCAIYNIPFVFCISVAQQISM